MIDRLTKLGRSMMFVGLLALLLSGCSLTNQTGSQTNPNTAQGAVLGQLVTTDQIGQSNAPVNPTTSFSATSQRIYAVAQAQSIDPGTSMFARWSRDGQPFEDSQPVTANKAYQNTYVEFHLQPVSGNFDPGQYTVQIFVNGNPDKQANFTVR